MWDVPIVAIAPTLLGATAAVLLGRFLPRIRGTTLIGPWCWMLAALSMVTLASAVSAWQGQRLPDWIEYILAVTTFCPLMALMGARRPHHHGWIFIVVTFWLVLSLPALQVRLTRAGDTVEAAGAWSLLLVALLVVAFVTVLPSVYRWGGLLAVSGQVLLLSEWIGWDPLLVADRQYWGRCFWLAGIAIASLWPQPDYTRHSDFDAMWLRFRDHFGGLWALRITERLNAFLTGQSIDLRLRMRGICDSSGAPAEGEIDPACWKAFSNLLRRFVSPDWAPARQQATMLTAPAEREPAP